MRKSRRVTKKRHEEAGEEASQESQPDKPCNMRNRQDIMKYLELLLQAQFAESAMFAAPQAYQGSAHRLD